MRSINRFSIIASALVLLGILSILSIWYFQAEKTTSAPSQNTAAAQKKKAPQTPAPKLTEEEKDALRLEREAARTDQSVEEIQKTIEENPEEQVRREAEHAQTLSPEEARSNLVHKKRQLDKMSDENVEGVVEFLDSKSPDLPKRETTAQQEVPIEDFDIDSAQIDDCVREQKEDGTFQYYTVLFDAKGNFVRVPMNESEGESMYRTMKTIQSSPMMEMIYRRMVLPLLDKQLSGKETPK